MLCALCLPSLILLVDRGIQNTPPIIFPQPKIIIYIRQINHHWECLKKLWFFLLLNDAKHLTLIPLLPYLWVKILEKYGSKSDLSALNPPFIQNIFVFPVVTLFFFVFICSNILLKEARCNGQLYILFFSPSYFQNRPILFLTLFVTPSYGIILNIILIMPKSCVKKRFR